MERNPAAAVVVLNAGPIPLGNDSRWRRWIEAKRVDVAVYEAILHKPDPASPGR